MSNVDEVTVTKDGELTRFVVPFGVNIPALRVRIQSGEETIAQFVKLFLLPSLRESIMDGVTKELEKEA